VHRRAFVRSFALALLAPPLAQAQQAGKVYRIGILTLSVASSTPIFAHGLMMAPQGPA
jgi:hypothetical protein